MMRLNLGCGDDRRDGYVNIDLRDNVADVVCDVATLPCDDGEVDEILALDLLEHFPPFRTGDLLAEWRRVLAPGGTLELKVPNMFELASAVAKGWRTELMIRNIYGGHRWGPDGAWDAHHTGWTPDMLDVVLRAAGFHVVSNDGALNMTVVAKKVG